MSKVINISGRTVELLGWKVLPDNRVVSPRGAVADALPNDVVYSTQAKHLADLDLITIKGYKTVQAPKKPVAEKPVMETVAPGVDDLTELANIGASRVRKLNAKGVYTFQNLIDFGADELSDLFQIDGAVASFIIEEAIGKYGAGSE